MATVFSFQENTIYQQQQNLERVLKRSVMQTYALEGRYPSSLDEIIEQYHITYDQDTFAVEYQITASNMMPDITVIKKAGGHDVKKLRPYS